MKMLKKEKVKKGVSPMDAALHYLTYSARSVREVERYLDERQYGEVEVMETVERLKELGMLDDYRFASDFVESRLRTKPVSRQHLKNQLMAHEVPSECIEAALNQAEESNDAENARILAGKYFGQMESIDPIKRRERILRRLISHGFSYHDACSAYESIEQLHDSEEESL